MGIRDAPVASSASIIHGRRPHLKVHTGLRGRSDEVGPQWLQLGPAVVLSCAVINGSECESRVSGQRCSLITTITKVIS